MFVWSVFVPVSLGEAGVRPMCVLVWIPRWEGTVSAAGLAAAAGRGEVALPAKAISPLTADLGVGRSKSLSIAHPLFADKPSPA